MDIKEQSDVPVSGLPGDLESCAVILEMEFEMLVGRTGEHGNPRLTTSVIKESQSGCDRRCLITSTRPCSAAHISAVLPSSSWILMSAPASRSRHTMSALPCDTASIKAVWQCCRWKQGWTGRVSRGKYRVESVGYFRSGRLLGGPCLPSWRAS